MRKDNHRWDAPVADKSLERPGLSIRQVSLNRMTLISGPFPETLRAAGLAHAVGWPDIAIGPSYALRLRRDRILVADGPDLSEGWNADTGLAISDMTSGYAVFEIAGQKAMGFLQRGTEISTGKPSASVNRAFHGLAAMIYAWETKECFRLHVASPMQETFWHLAGKLADC